MVTTCIVFPRNSYFSRKSGVKTKNSESYLPTLRKNSFTYSAGSIAGNSSQPPAYSDFLSVSCSALIPERPLQTPEAVACYIRQQPALGELLGISTTDDYLKASSTKLSIGDSSDQFTVSELSGGRINFVWRVSGPKREFVLKYAAPFVRSIGPEFQLSQSRLGVEAEAMTAAHAACPEHVPALLLYDPAANVLVQELVSGPQGRPRVKLVDALATRGLDSVIGCDVDASAAAAAAASADQSRTDTPARGIANLTPPPPPHLAADLATLLAGYLLRNSVYELPYDRLAAASKRLRNSEVVAANAAVVFTDPWDTTCERNRLPQYLEAEVGQLRSDPTIRQEVTRLLDLYLSSSETLIHNDLTAGNILVPEPVSCGALRQDFMPGAWDSEESLVNAVAKSKSCGISTITTTTATTSDMTGSSVGGGGGGIRDCNGFRSDTHLIDWEFATYGPMSYDIGSLLGNLLLSYCASCGAGGPVVPELSEAAVAAAQNTAAAGRDYPLEPAGGMKTLPRSPLLLCITELWEQLEERIRSYRLSKSASSAAASEHPGGAPFVSRLLSDSLGYTGCVMSRLLFGMHHYPALEAIPNGPRRVSCHRLALRLAAALLHPQKRAALGWAPDRHEELHLPGAAVGSESNRNLAIWSIRRLALAAEQWAAEEEEEEQQA